MMDKFGRNLNTKVERIPKNLSTGTNKPKSLINPQHDVSSMMKNLYSTNSNMKNYYKNYRIDKNKRSAPILPSRNSDFSKQRFPPHAPPKVDINIEPFVNSLTESRFNFWI